MSLGILLILGWRRRDVERRPYHGIDNDKHDSQECQGLKTIQVFVSQDPVVLTGDQANLVDYQLFWKEGEESEISDQSVMRGEKHMMRTPHH